MAIRASCPHCKRTFSAPEEYRGKKVGCPACGRRFLLRTPEELDAAAKEVEERQRKREEDRERLALIERMESRGQRRIGRPYYEEFQTGQEGVRHFHPRSHSRFARFRALSDFLVLGAYLELLLVSVGVGLLIYLKISGVIAAFSVLFLWILGWLAIGASGFLLLKYLGELAFLLADMADQQNDVVQLLQDIRENTDTKSPEA